MRVLRLMFALPLILLVAIQFVPLGRGRTNPPVQAEPAWNSPQTRALARRACFDCHSNETIWPAYAYVAPVSWLVVRDVLGGRRKLNFSEWGVSGRKQAVDDIPKVLRRGSMPPGKYVLLHPDAKLTAEERQQLLDGLIASLR